MNTIINPINGEKYDLYSTKGSTLLKEYIQNYKIGGMDVDDDIALLQVPPEYHYPFLIWDPDVGFIKINNYRDIIRLIEYPSMTEKDVRPISEVPINELTDEQRTHLKILTDWEKRRGLNTQPRRSERLRLKPT